METIKVNFDIKKVEFPFIKEILTKLGASNISSESNDIFEIPQEHLESINKGFDDIKNERTTKSNDVHKKAIELCMK